MSPLPVEDLFSRMRAERVERADASDRESERARVVAHMKSVHVTLVHERGRRFAPRRMGGLLLVAAVIAFAGTALAGAAGHGPAAGWFASPAKIAVLPKAREPGGSSREPPAPSVTPAPAPGVATPATATATERVSPLVARAPVKRSADVKAPTALPAKTRELELVNRLFADAKRARREHRDADALALLDELLGKYPRSLLAHEASVERFRALSRLGRGAEARRRAEAYLATYPKGFAVEEARALVAPSAR